MASAYTPGLTVSEHTNIRRIRRLPLKGEVYVKVGDKVTAETVAAGTQIPGIMQTIRVAESLGLEPEDAINALRIKEGDQIKAGDLLAESKSFFGLFKSECKSPYSGKVELISHRVGHVGVRLPSTPVEVLAYIDGTVTEIMPGEGVVVETPGALVQGIFGIGGERTGILKVPFEDISKSLSLGDLTPDMSGCVVVCGGSVDAQTIRRAETFGVKGIVVGSIIDTDLVSYLGYDIGVAITGQEDIPLTLILTEGFGDIKMADRTFKLLKSLDGRKVSINGATQIRAGVIRPEIAAPGEYSTDEPKEPQAQTLEIGSKIRIIRDPYFGMLANVTALPVEPVKVDSGAVVRVLEAQTSDGETVTVPRANVEIIVG
jgi:hypothetical protein